MLKVENLTLHYGQSQILHGISLGAEPGKVTAVMGTNGVGKTSLLKAIAGRHPYSSGTISLDAAPAVELADRQRLHLPCRGRPAPTARGAKFPGPDLGTAGFRNHRANRWQLGGAWAHDHRSRPADRGARSG